MSIMESDRFQCWSQPPWNLSDGFKGKGPQRSFGGEAVIVIGLSDDHNHRVWCNFSRRPQQEDNLHADTFRVDGNEHASDASRDSYKMR
jgi:hypothetical protein